mmetsp:Transcript_9004/g.10534  ORF Transcript_9004/g.10534 Transcript_9004/m.10534 type:complete len:89 (-) Transcript_9004:1524-1790(-)
MIEFIDFVDIAKSASRHTAPFTISVLKLKCLKTLKFWIEDKLRMNKPLAVTVFTLDTLNDCIQLYASAVATKNNNVKFVVGPQFDPND